MASASDPIPDKSVPSPPSSSPASTQEHALGSSRASGGRTKTIDALASLDAAFSEVSTSQTAALESLDGLMRELAACEEASAVPASLSPALETASALRSRVRRASRKLQRATRRASRVREALAGLKKEREEKELRQDDGGDGGGGDNDNEESSL